MCRIFGFSGLSNDKVTTLLRGLLLVEGEDNPHGTGIVIKRPWGETILRKKGVNAVTFLLQGHADFLWWQKYRYALGHVRFKTVGEQSDRNSHPFGFRIGNRWHYGVHNGVINCTEELASEFGVKAAQVDSETFWRCIAKLQRDGEDVVTAIERVTHFISDKGNFAFAYMTENEIFLWRNEIRPICVFDARKHGMGRFFASTKEMFVRAWLYSCPELDVRKVTYSEIEPYVLYRMAGETVKIVKQLKHKIRRTVSYRSLPYGRYSYSYPSDYIQWSLWED